MSDKKIKKNSNLSYYLLCAFSIFLMFFAGRIIPPFAAEITTTGMQILFLFLGMVILWSTVGGVIWPSILAIIALGLTDYTTVNASIVSALGQVALWQTTFAIILASTITISGAGEYLARWIMSRKILQGHPWIFTVVFLIAMTLISSVTNGIAMLVLAWAIVRGIAKIVDSDIKEAYFRIMSVMLIPACAFGEFVFPFRSWVGALWNAFANVLGQSLDYGPYIIITFVLSIIVDICLVLYMRILQVDISMMTKFDNTVIIEKFKNESLNSKQKTYLYTMLVCMIVALVSNVAPRDSALYAMLNNLSVGGVFGVGVAFLILLRDKDNKPVMDWFDITAKAPIWGAFFIVASAIPVASALCSEATGFMAWTSKILSPFFSNISLWLIYFIIILACLILTNLASNTGVAMMMIPLTIPLASAAGANPYMIGICVIFSSCMGLILPGASALSAAVYGMLDEQELRMQDIIIHGGMMLLMYLVLATIVFAVLDPIIGL